MKCSSSYPCLFGCISINGEFPLNERIFDSRKVFGVGDTLAIYQSGMSPEIHQFIDGAKCFILFGRIYSPNRINQLEAHNEMNLRSLFDCDLNRVSGSFVIIKVSESDCGTVFSLSTDKYGFKRILYLQDGERLYFATHIYGLKILFNSRLPGISTEALLHYYNFGFTPNNQTIIEGIRKVPPGSTLAVKNGDVSINPYFSIKQFYHPEKYTCWSEKKISKAIDNLLLRAVCRRIPGNSNVGVALSGGVDSAYITQKLVQSGAYPVGYNLAYNEYYNEFDRINYLANVLRIKVCKISVSPSQIIENYEYCNSISSEPMGFNNAAMRFVALKAKKDGISVLFDGDGSDRIFLGMSQYLKFQKVLWTYNFLKKARLLSLIKPILNFLPGIEFKKLYIHFQNWSKGICPYPERNMGGLTRYNADYEQKVYNLAVKQFRESFEREFLTDDFGLYFTYQAIQMCSEMFFYDPSEIQTELGLFPIQAFWDDDLVSIAISLPIEMKLRSGKTKYILRRAAARNLDPNYWILPKIGLQNSFAYIVQSEEGQAWRDRKREKVRDLKEYKALLEILPGGAVDPDKLIGLAVWKELNAIR